MVRIPSRNSYLRARLLAGRHNLSTPNRQPAYHGKPSFNLRANCPQKKSSGSPRYAAQISAAARLDANAVNLIAMNEEELFDQSFWLSIAMNLPQLQNDPEGAEHLVERFVGQYLPVLLRPSGPQGTDHVWLAFWHYLVAPSTKRKPFGLSSGAADLVIVEFQNALSGPR